MYKFQKVLLKFHGDETIINTEVKLQIVRDITRTYPKVPFFSNKGEGIVILQRILLSYAVHVKQIGYTQGMNFICATLLYHAKEYVAFHLFAIIMEKYLCDIYTENLVGLITESNKLKFTIDKDVKTKRISKSFVI